MRWERMCFMTLYFSAQFRIVLQDNCSHQTLLRGSTISAHLSPKRKTKFSAAAWRWGELHTVTFRHPFGSRKPLGSVFNIGPFPLSGGGTTVDKTEYKFTAP